MSIHAKTDTGIQFSIRTRAGIRAKATLLACVIVLLLPGMAGCGSNDGRQYTQLFTRNGQVHVLAGDGALYNLTGSGKATLPEIILPTGSGNGVLAGDRYFYISGQRLMAYHLAQLRSQSLYEAGAGTLVALQLALPDRIVFSTTSRQGDRFGPATFHVFDLATGQVAPLIGPPFTENRSLTFLAHFGDHYYFSGGQDLKLAAVSLQDRIVNDLSGQVEFAPTHACISSGLLYLEAWRKALYIVDGSDAGGSQGNGLPSGEAEAGGGDRPGIVEPTVRQVELAPEIGDPGAMAPYGDGILLCADDPVQNAAIYQLHRGDPQTGKGFQLTRKSDPERFIGWNVWQIAVSGDRFYGITGTGKTLVIGSLGPPA